MDELAVNDAVITVKADLPNAPARWRVTYGELVSGKQFNITLTGSNVYLVAGKAKTKSIPKLRYACQSIQRDDIPGKVDGSLKWAVDVKLQGMVHAQCETAIRVREADGH